MRVAIIIFARMDSRRVPGKVLADLGGKPLLHYVVARAKRSRHDVIVATSYRPVDEPIVKFAKTEGLRYFCGKSDDVVGRAVACASDNRLDAFVRISGDSPFIDPHLIDRIAGTFLAEDSIDIATNVFPRTYPTGLSVEVISRAGLSKVAAETFDKQDREHITRYMYSNPDLFRILNCPADVRYDANLQLTVDDAGDLDRARWMIGAGADTDASLEKVLHLAGQYREFSRVSVQGTRR
jgi:spore coat polysaccharide biosynthesis protein SpsF